MKPTELGKFQDETSLDVRLLCETIIEHNDYFLEPHLRQEFLDHADQRVRWLHVHDHRWKQKLNSHQGREWAEMFIKHWIKALLGDPFLYYEKHSIELLT